MLHTGTVRAWPRTAYVPKRCFPLSDTRLPFSLVKNQDRQFIELAVSRGGNDPLLHLNKDHNLKDALNAGSVV